LDKATENKFFGAPTVENVLKTPPGTYLKLLETQIDPSKSKTLESVIKISFTDSKKSWALHVRKGVAEVTDVLPEKVDATLQMQRKVWAEISIGNNTVAKAIDDGDINVKGSKKIVKSVFEVFN